MLTEEQILMELEMILATAKQINRSLASSIELLAAPVARTADYSEMLRTNAASVRQILALLETHTATAAAPGSPENASGAIAAVDATADVAAGASAGADANAP